MNTSISTNQEKLTARKILSLEKAKIANSNEENVEKLRFFGNKIIGRREKS